MFATKESGERVSSEVRSLHVMDRKQQHSSVHMVSPGSGANCSVRYYQQEKQWANRQKCSYSKPIYCMGDCHSAVNILFSWLYSRKKETFTRWHTMMKVLTLILPLKHGRISAWTTKTASSHNCFFLPQFLYFSRATYKHTYTYKKKTVTNDCMVCCYTRKHILNHSSQIFLAWELEL